MRKLYVDPGYREKTHITLVTPGPRGKDKVTFREVGPFQDFTETADYLVNLMVEQEVELDDFYCPHFPGIEKMIKDRFRGYT